MTQRVLRTRVRVTGDDGEFVVLRAGQVVPEEYESQITNPRCYVDTTSLEQPVEAVAPTPPPVPEDEPKPKPEPEPEKAPEPTPVEESDAPVVYEDLTVAELADLLEGRELPVSGAKRELIARLKADDAK